MLPSVSDLFVLLAAQNGPEPVPGGCGEGAASFVPILLMFAIFYLVVILPSRKERKQHQAMLDALKRGDEVLTSSGILGTITDIADPFVTLEISRNVKVRILRSAIAKKHVEAKKEKAEAEKAEQA